MATGGNFKIVFQSIQIVYWSEMVKEKERKVGFHMKLHKMPTKMVFGHPTCPTPSGNLSIIAIYKKKMKEMFLYLLSEDMKINVVFRHQQWPFLNLTNLCVDLECKKSCFGHAPLWLIGYWFVISSIASESGFSTSKIFKMQYLHK